MSTRIAYLISRYPAISHTFILREVRALRASGLGIDVASINLTDRPVSQLTAEERDEASQTFYIKTQGFLSAVRACLAECLSHPTAFWRGWAYALHLAGPDLCRALYCGGFYFAEAVLLGRWMRTQGHNHVHVHFATEAATVALLASHIFPISYSIMVHGPDEFYHIDRYLLPQKFLQARFLIAISQYARSQILRLLPGDRWDRVDLAPLGVNTDIFTPAPFRESPDPFEILCVGRLTPAKGQRVLIRAAERLMQQGKHIRVRFVGDGPDREALQKETALRKLESVVVFEGSVNQDSIRAFYAKADIFALASFAEGLPVVLMEAMAMERPCVTTWITGIPELIRDHIDGLLIPPGDDEALANALARLIDDPRLRRRLGLAGRCRVAACHELEFNTARLATVFHDRLAQD